MRRLQLKLKELGVELAIIDMKKPGCYILEWKKIFVNENLSEEQMKLVILHELKHALDHSDYIELYKCFPIHSKMENEANMYMLDEIIKENDGVYNYWSIVDEFKINMGHEVKFAR